MTLAIVAGNLLAGNRKVSESTWNTVTSTNSVAAGQLAVIIVASDNTDATDGDNNSVTSVSLGGVSATKVAEFENAQAGAGNGATTSIWYIVAASDIASGSTLAVVFASAIVAKAATGLRFSRDTSKSIVIDGINSLANDGADPGSLTTTGAEDVEHLWVRGIAGETSSAVAMTPTSGWTAFVGSTTAGSGGATNMQVRGEHSISSGTSATSDPTVAAFDWASLLVGFYEVSAGPATSDVPGRGSSARHHRTSSIYRT